MKAKILTPVYLTKVLALAKANCDEGHIDPALLQSITFTVGSYTAMYGIRSMLEGTMSDLEMMIATIMPSDMPAEYEGDPAPEPAQPKKPSGPPPGTVLN